MKMYFLSLAAGFLAGLLYGALNVRSPAPPLIALLGLLGILLGEQAMPLVKHAFDDDAARKLGIRSRMGQHLFGHLPGHAGDSVDFVASNEIKSSLSEHGN